MIQNLNILSNASIYSQLFEKEKSPGILSLIEASLLRPIEDFFQYPGKNIRARLVELGYLLSCPEEPGTMTEEIRSKVHFAGQIVELIHGGSLIVDDIQDGSVTRRNGPTLHLKHGMPLALNAGNWLYFWALSSIEKLELESSVQNALTEDVLRLLIKAHTGQALDLGTDITEVSQDSIEETCRTSMELKTGTLMCLGLRLGAAIAERCLLPDLQELGMDLGFYLQMQDDRGNFLGQRDPVKKFEDLLLNRPTFIWAQASRLSPIIFEEFKDAVSKLPDEELLVTWVRKNSFQDKLAQSIRVVSDNNLRRWTEKWEGTNPAALNILNKIIQKVEQAYV